MQQLVRHDITPAEAVVGAGIAADELTETRGIGAAVVAALVDDDQVAFRQGIGAEDFAIAGHLLRQQLDEQVLAGPIALAQYQGQPHAAHVQGFGRRRAEEQGVVQQLAPIRHGETVFAAGLPRGLGFPALRQFEADVDGALHRLARRQHQRIAGRHQAFVGVIGHFLDAGWPGVLVVFERDVVTQAHAPLAAEFVVALAQVLDRQHAAVGSGDLEPPDEIGLAVGVRRGRQYAEHREAVRRQPDVGLDLGEARAFVDTHDIGIAAAVVIGGRRRALSATLTAEQGEGGEGQ